MGLPSYVNTWLGWSPRLRCSTSNAASFNGTECGRPFLWPLPATYKWRRSRLICFQCKRLTLACLRPVATENSTISARCGGNSASKRVNSSRDSDRIRPSASRNMPNRLAVHYPDQIREQRSGGFKCSASRHRCNNPRRSQLLDSRSCKLACNAFVVAAYRRAALDLDRPRLRTRW